MLKVLGGCAGKAQNVRRSGKRLAAKDRNNKIMNMINIKSGIVVIIGAPRMMGDDAVYEGNAEGFDCIMILLFV